MPKLKKVKLTFCGGGGSVTGANILLEEEGGLKILLDCGLFQGVYPGEDPNRRPFAYNPKEIDYLIVSHAHLDHVGRIPLLVKNGFHGKILSTPPTRDIAEAMLIDSIGLLTKEAKYEGVPPIYSEEDVTRAMELWQEGIPYHCEFQLNDFKVQFKDAGHILGSAMTELTYRNKKIVYTGDLGNSPNTLLPDTEEITDADYLIMESVYGDRNHESREAANGMLEDAIEDTVNKKGVLMIPAFSIEKTQEILFQIKHMMEESRIPLIKVFLDSPLAIKVTEIYQRYSKYYNGSAKGEFGFDPKEGIFGFPQLHQTLHTEESIAIKGFANPKIIIAGSGMSNGGRIVHHEKNYLPDARNTLLITGYQSVGTPGRILQEGASHIRIMGEEIDVKAKLVSITGYSGHKGADDLLDFVNKTSDSVKRVFVALGEPKSSLTMVQKIRDYLALDAVAPEEGQSFELEL